MRGTAGTHPARSALRPLSFVLLAAAATACASSARSSTSQPGEPRPTLGIAPVQELEAVAVTLPVTTVVATIPPAGTSSPTSTTPPAPDSSSAPTESSSTVPVAPTTTVPVLPHGFAPVTDQQAQPYAAVGKDSGPETKRIQMRLLELGFWLQGVDGQYGHTTIQAVMAMQKYYGLPITGAVDAATANALTSAMFRATASATDGTLVEVDKTRQLLFLVKDGRTLWAFNTSTGSGKSYRVPNVKEPWRTEEGDSITPSGLWEVYRQNPEGWWDGDLGKIYRPKYFKGGIAIHGMNSIPGYPASHGCVRLSLPAMDFIWDNDLVPKGTTVWVHGDDPVRT